jgi:hypothetical protein
LNKLLRSWKKQFKDLYPVENDIETRNM